MTEQEELIIKAFQIVQACSGKVEFPYEYPLTKVKSKVMCYTITPKHIRIDIIDEK